jgi:hypothetical protein
MDSSPILAESTTTTDAIILSDTEEETPNPIINSDVHSCYHIPLEVRNAWLCPFLFPYIV